MITFIIFIGLIVAFFQISGLRNKVRTLEKRVNSENNSTVNQGQAQNQHDQSREPEYSSDFNNNYQENSQNNLVSRDQADYRPESLNNSSEPDVLDRFQAWAKEDWMLKLGALLLIIGFGWLTSYAFLNNWIGPVGRISMGIILGLSLMVFGWHRIKTYIHQGGTFMVTGSTIVLMTIFAARSLYDFLTPGSALAFMFLTTVFVAIAALKYNNRALAVASIILAGIAPLLTASPEASVPELFMYLMVVTLGTIWMVFITGRRELTAISLIMVFLYSLPYISRADETVMAFVFIFAAIFMAANMFTLLKLRGEDIKSDVMVAAGNSLMLIIWILAAIPEEWKSLVLVVWMLFFVLCSFLVFKQTSSKHPFFVYAGVSAILLVIATAIEFEGYVLFYAFLAEAVLLTLGTLAVTGKPKIASSMGASLLIPGLISLESFDVNYRWDLPASDFMVILSMGIALVIIGYLLLPKTDEQKDESLEKYSGLKMVIGSVYLYALLWLSLHSVMSDTKVAVITSLVIYTIVGIAFYVYGIKRDSKGILTYGGTIVALVIARLFIVDVWWMDISGKIVVFFFVGALLISTAFYARKKEAKEEPFNNNY